MLDRNRQKEILEILASCYPDISTDVIDANSSTDIANLYYLKEHELVNASLRPLIGGSFVFQGASISAKGLDFLADDGGLSAILGTITIKLHADSVKELINEKISSLNLSTDKQKWFKEKIDTISGEALKTITKSLVEQGLSHTPDLLNWIQNILPK